MTVEKATRNQNAEIENEWLTKNGKESREDIGIGKGKLIEMREKGCWYVLYRNTKFIYGYIDILVQTARKASKRLKGMDFAIMKAEESNSKQGDWR